MLTRPPPARNIVITGASSGLGAALALHYANPQTHLALLGRDGSRLGEVADQCRLRGSAVTSFLIDVRERELLETSLLALDSERPTDLVIANAGVMEGTPPGGVIEPSNAAYHLMETNVLGVMNTVQPLLAQMMERRSGQIAIVSSIAAFTPLADAPSYSASKSAVLNYGLSLRALVAEMGVRINVICPGYIETPMMDREHGDKPFKMSAPRAADLIARGLAADRATIVFPFFFGWLTWISGLLPDGIRRQLGKGFRFTVG